MSTEKNKTIMMKIINATNTGDSSRLHDVIRDVVADDFVGHVAGTPDYHGPDGFMEALDLHHSAFSDMGIEVVDQIAEGDLVMTYYVWTGTHADPSLGIPPTGRRVSVPTVGIARFRDGKLVENTDIWDNLYVYQQLGADVDIKVPEAKTS